jgi:hypothetical protein
MRYIMFIYTDEEAENRMSQPEKETIMQQYFAFSGSVRERGFGEALYPSSDSTTVRRRDGKLLTTDGPFVESKEQVGGFYLLECADLDEAIQIAARIPSIDIGAVEIRPVVDFNN